MGLLVQAFDFFQTRWGSPAMPPKSIPSVSEPTQPARHRKRRKPLPGGRRGPQPIEMKLPPFERKILEVDVRRNRASYEEVMRAKIILALADNPCVSDIAEKLGLDRRTVRKWRDRYLERGRKGLRSLPGQGREPTIDAVSRCQIVAMACGKPKDFGVLHRNVWTLDALLQAYLSQFPDLAQMSRSSILRILNAADLRPHRMRYWLHSPDPAFRAKVTAICNLYLAPPEGATVLCIDEKTGMQALGRKHPTKMPEPGQAGRFEYEYIRNGTRKLLAALNPHTGEVYGQMRAHRKAEDLVDFMEEIARRHPDGDVYVVWDNLNIHYDGADKRWTRFNQRHGGRFHFVYTPIHASWVNQIELFFGILQRRILRYGVFDNLEQIDHAVLDFVEYWNAHERKPFRWTFKGYPLQIGSS